MLVVDRLHKGFGAVVAVDEVSFEVPAGSTFGLIGPNGAGKTTTMRSILGIYAPDSGTITWKGAAVHAKTRRHFGYLPEERGLYGKMKVREQIVYFGKLHGLPEAECQRRTTHWLARLEIAQYAERPCSELSKGNQQKVQIACAAVHEPELLVLDEPFSGLDPVNAEMLIGILSELKHAGTTLVLSSHNMWQMEDLCDRFCIVAGGRNRAGGTLRELRAAWPTRVIRVAPPTDSVRGVLSALDGARALPPVDGVLEFDVPASTPFADVLARLVAGEKITRFEAVEPSLHDIYLHTVEGI